MSLNIRGLAFKDVDASGHTLAAMEMSSMHQGAQRTIEFQDMGKAQQLQSRDEDNWA